MITKRAESHDNSRIILTKTIVVNNVLGTTKEMMAGDKPANDTPGPGMIADMKTTIPVVANESNT